MHGEHGDLISLLLLHQTMGSGIQNCIFSSLCGMYFVECTSGVSLESVHLCESPRSVSSWSHDLSHQNEAVRSSRRSVYCTLCHVAFVRTESWTADNTGDDSTFSDSSLLYVPVSRNPKHFMLRINRCRYTDFW
jgi:hypothetical protein